MGAARVDLEAIQGDTFKRTLTFERPAGTPMDLTGYVLKSQLRLFAGDTGTPAAEFELLAGLEAHQKILRLTSTIMASLIARNYWWDFQWITPGGETETKLQGIFTVSPQTTLP